MRQPDHSFELLNEVMLATKHLGPNKVKKILSKARYDEDLVNAAMQERESYENHLIKLLCRHFLISKEELISGKSRQTNRLNALVVGYVITKKTLDYTLRETAYMFKKDQSNINKEIIRFNKFKREDSTERQLIEACNLITAHLKKFMNIKKPDA